MEAVTVRLLPWAVADGAHNMAADEVLLKSATAGIASLRFYGWSEPTLSLGYFQPERLRREDAKLQSLPFVRRPSGGATLVHHHELTYALALPAGRCSRPGMHFIIFFGLRRFGVYAITHAPAGEQHTSGMLCFHQFSAGDVILSGAKVVGSAQRRSRGAVMQHGGILLAASAYTPTLPGIRELSGVDLPIPEMCSTVCEVLRDLNGWTIVEGDWSAEERRLVEELARTKYGDSAWNAKR